MIKPKQTIRYWGRKAGFIAKEYILSYSKEDEVVLDPFGGSGSIAKEALINNRKVIYNDLNPLAFLIAKVEIKGAGKEFLKAASKVISRKRVYFLDKLSRRRWIKVSSLYSCQGKEIKYFVWDKEKIIDSKPECDDEIPSYESLIEEPLYYYPKAMFYYEDGSKFYKKRQVDRVDELFTKRNLLILSSLLKDIKRAKTDQDTKDALYYAFASILFQASKMSRINAGSWGINSYWIPQVHLEKNPYVLFKNALKKISLIKPLALRTSYNVKDIEKGAQIVFLNQDAAELNIPDSYVDLVITDPPFTDEIQYFELSYLAASWLGMKLPFEKEIIVNPNQNKSIKRYFDMLSKSFEAIYRVLKPGGHAVIMFHEEDENGVLKIKELLQKAGFIIENVDLQYMQQRKIGERNESKGKELLVFTCSKQ